MLFALKNNVIFKLLAHADGVSQLIFWALIGMSIICWWICIYKWYSLRRKIAQVNAALLALEPMTTLEEVVRLSGTLHKSFSGKLITSGLVAFRRSSKAGIIGQEQELIQLSIGQTLSAMLKREEKYLGIIRLSSETGTLIGLFGTVWGLIHAFNRMSERKVADIATVAPGIAEALIVTLAGLFVAIPALVMYYVVTQKIQILEERLSGIADRLIVLFALKSVQAASELYETSVSLKP